jgi:hypothetical protein
LSTLIPSPSPNIRRREFYYCLVWLQCWFCVVGALRPCPLGAFYGQEACCALPLMSPCCALLYLFLAFAICFHA